MLQVLARRMRLEGTFDFAAVAAKTPGYVGADLAALTKEAGAHAITRVFTSLKSASRVRNPSNPLAVWRQCIPFYIDHLWPLQIVHGAQVFLSVPATLRSPTA